MFCARRIQRASLLNRWTPYGAISLDLKRAIIVAEDAKFVDHEGFDWEGIQHAMDRNQKRGKIVAGGSTITQQLAKNLFLSGERSTLRKAQEAAITAMLEVLMDKRRIFEIYLNVAEWGENVFGAEAAALSLLRRKRSRSCAGAGRSPGCHAAAPALLRPPPRLAVSF